MTMFLRAVQSQYSNILAWKPLNRYFAVKELPWCSKGLPPHKAETSKLEKNPKILQPIPAFGIVAAMTKNHIIGVNGILPWNIPEDRQDFIQLTKGKVLIIGRKTLEEQTALSHISHVAKCIVISKTIEKSNIKEPAKLEIHVVQSFPEALDLARRINGVSLEKETESPNELQCWVAGGEGVYNVAVLHPSARVLQLTVIDMEVEVETAATNEIVRFPPKYHWDTKFRLASVEETTTTGDHAVKFTKYLYIRK